MLPRCEPVSVQIPLVECGEPLVDLREQAVLRIDPGLAGDFVWVRLSLLDRLVTAQTLLPARVKLLVRQGYRAANPAHAAGAAVDLGLCTRDGGLVDSGDDWGEHDWGELVTALQKVGLVNHPTEWRHWSYGDSYWAYKTGAAAARYGPGNLRRCP